MKENKPSSISKKNPHVIFTLNFLLVSLMLSCFAFILGKFIQHIDRDWQTTGFATLAFFVTLESLIVRYSQKQQSKILYNHIIYTLTEIIFIILIIKTLSITLDPSTQILDEISSWSDNFFQSFFDGNTLLRVMGILAIWALSWLFSFPLNTLKEDQDLMAQEKLGHTFTDRYEARRNLTRLVFSVGFIMLILMGILNNILISSPIFIPAGSLLIAMLTYFSASFVLLALNQYAIMKARWYLNDIPVRDDLSKQWVLYSVIFIMAVISIIVFLPTSFTIGFRPIAQVTLNFFLIIWAIIQLLISIPISLLFPQRDTPLEDTPINELFQQENPDLGPLPSQAAGPIPWLEFVKSVLFWVVFIFVVCFSVYYFIKNKYGFEFFIKNVKIGAWLIEFWQWIKEGLTKIQQSAAENVQKGSEKFKAYWQRRKRALDDLTELIRILPPRQSIILNYVEWLRWNTKIGIGRHKSQTPHEYAKTCNQINPQASALVNAFTDVFISARYSKQKIRKEQAEASKKLLRNLKEAFSQHQPGQETNQ